MVATLQGGYTNQAWHDGGVGVSIGSRGVTGERGENGEAHRPEYTHSQRAHELELSACRNGWGQDSERARDGGASRLTLVVGLQVLKEAQSRRDAAHRALEIMLVGRARGAERRSDVGRARGRVVALEERVGSEEAGYKPDQALRISYTCKRWLSCGRAHALWCLDLMMNDHHGSFARHVPPPQTHPGLD